VSVERRDRTLGLPGKRLWWNQADTPSSGGGGLTPVEVRILSAAFGKPRALRGFLLSVDRRGTLSRGGPGCPLHRGCSPRACGGRGGACSCDLYSEALAASGWKVIARRCIRSQGRFTTTRPFWPKRGVG